MPYPKIALDGAVVAVTGGARGIGKATADLFTARGAVVCVGDLDPASADALVVDVTARESFGAFVDTVIDRHGRIDILVNNAGVMPLGDFLSEDDAISRTTLEVNVWGLIHGMRAVMPHMVDGGEGMWSTSPPWRASWWFRGWRSTTPVSSRLWDCPPRSERNTAVPVSV